MSVCECVCMCRCRHACVCVWYTELTCIPDVWPSGYYGSGPRLCVWYVCMRMCMYAYVCVQRKLYMY